MLEECTPFPPALLRNFETLEEFFHIVNFEFQFLFVCCILNGRGKERLRIQLIQLLITQFPKISSILRDWCL